MAVILFFDLETTGIDPEKCGIHQISGSFVVNGRIAESFNYYVKPKEGCECSEKAMEMAGHTYEEMMALDEYEPMDVVFNRIYDRILFYCGGKNQKGYVEWNKKIYVGGYNIHKFDCPFMRQWFIDNGKTVKDPKTGEDKSEWGYLTSGEIDVMLIVEPVLMRVRSRMKNVKQYSVAQALGIPVDESRLHEAGYDIELCFDIYKTVVERGYIGVMPYDDFGKSTQQIMEERQKALCDTKILENLQVSSEQSVKR